MQGYSPKIPYTKDNIDGFSMNKTALESIKQDFKMLILTNPGERIMNTDYGVGIKKYLFEQKNSDALSKLNKRIYEQVGRYMNFIQIINIEINEYENIENAINIKLYYYIPNLKQQDQLELSLGTN